MVLWSFQLFVLSDNMNLAEISKKRKEELLSLRSKLRKPDSEAVDHEKNNKDAKNADFLPRPKFRSYQPTSANLRDQVVPAAVPLDPQAEVISDITNRHLPDIENVNLTDLAPRKPDWDLKRAIELKLRKLERRTEKAIAEIVRTRLQQESKDEQVEVDENL